VQLLSTTQTKVDYKVDDSAEEYVKFPQGLIRLRVQLTDGEQFDRYFSPSRFFDFSYGYLYFNPERLSDLSAYNGIPLTLLDVSLKGHFPEN
jgi:hypothetical protein